MNKRENLADFLDGECELESPRALKSELDFTFRTKVSALIKDQRAGGRGVTTGQDAGHRLTVHSSWIPQIDKAIRNSFEFFSQTQYPEGYWWSELESNVTITSEYIMLLHLLGISRSEESRSMARYLLNQQSRNGSWGLFYGDKGNLSITVEAYFSLKLVGEDPESEPMVRARDFILRNGGVEATRVFTKIWLALFSQYDWDKISSMPVELVLLPSHFYFNIYEFSSWARGTVVPLSIVMSIRPRFTLSAAHAIPELYLPRRDAGPHKRFASFTHRLFFLFDRIAKAFERHPIRSLRNRAIDAAEAWILDHQEESGDWGGIQPPMVYSTLALHYLGYSVDHPVIVKGLKALRDFCIEDNDGMRMQSCVSPVWDTALTALALREAELPADHPSLKKATAWLLEQQVTSGGDWQIKNPSTPGGWAFEFVNTRYPDVDDSAVVLNTLHAMCSSPCEGLEEGKKRGMEWCLSMQSSSGGWAAFDKDNDMVILNRIPFADQEAMVDYPTADVTGRMLEAMGYYGYNRSHPRARKAIQFLRDLQEPDGAWWGRWGVNYIYGTWSVLRGLITIGENPKAPDIQAALQWIKDHQNPDGGWGETCESYMDPSLRGQGPSTPSQTAWAIMALITGGEHHCLEVHKGVQYLVRNQKSDGSWEELYFTGTGFPKHFFIRYHNYRNCFPLMALGQYRRKLKE